MNKILIILALLATTFVVAYSQEDLGEELMVVYLKDGSKLEGVVTNWVYKEALYLKTNSGQIFEFPADQIDKVVQKSLVNISSGEEYTFKESGIYYAWRGQALVGNNGDRNMETPGYGFSFLAGYRLNRLIGAGLGVGYDKYIDDTGEEVIPVFAEFSGYVSPSNTSLSYSLALGYGFARVNDEYGIIHAKGGLLVYPAIGVRLGQSRIKYTIDLGYKFQKAEFTYRNPWVPTTEHEQRLLYKRLTLRAGVMF